MTTLSKLDQDLIWHPFTQHQNSPSNIPIIRGQGSYVYDESEKAYLDLISSWWVNIHGHCHPFIVNAITEQLSQLDHVLFAGFTHEPAVAFSEKLLKTLPAEFTKIFYSDNGSTAIEVAIKMAHQYWRNRGETRFRYLSFHGGYHGDTIGAMSLGNHSGFFKNYFDLLFHVDSASYPSTWYGDQNIQQKETDSLQWIEKYLQDYKDEVAAIVIEPLIQGAGGMNLCRVEFLQELQSLARQYHVLVIYDEVLTGFYRTGSMFACEKSHTSPDIICLGKSISGGFLPLAATICHEYIYEAFLGSDMDKALIHGHSYTANPLACTAALASLELLQEESILKNIQMIEATHKENFPALLSTQKIQNIRLCGTLAAFNLKQASAYGSNFSQNLYQTFLKKGLLIRPLGNVIYLLPPYCIKQEELTQAYGEIIKVVEEIDELAEA